MLRTSLTAVVVVGMTGTASGQTVNVGPLVAPVGADILASVQNDTDETLPISAIGPIRVRDASGTEIFSGGIYFATPVLLPAGQVMRYYNWGQTDKDGNQVPPGNYTIDVDVNDTTTTWELVIGGPDAAIASVGVHRPATTRNLYVCSPRDPGGIYILAASFGTAPGIPTCGGTIPLNGDSLFELSLTPHNGVFSNFVGELTGFRNWTRTITASSVDPSIAVPNLPLQGLQFAVAFAVIDFSAPCPIVRVSDPLTITIQ